MKTISCLPYAGSVIVFSNFCELVYRMCWGIEALRVRIGLAYVLAYNPEGYIPQIYGQNITPKIYLKART